AIENHGDVIVEMALPFDDDIDASFACGLDEHLALAARRLLVAFDRYATESLFAREDVLRVRIGIDRRVDKVTLLCAPVDHGARADPSRPDRDAGQRRLRTFVASQLVGIWIKIGS